MWGPGAGQTPPCTRRGLGILLALLCQAQLSQGQVYRIQVAPHVTVQQGLCVLLPCHFTADFESPGPLYKYWFLEGADKDHGVPVASTNPDRPPQESRGRIRLAGEAEDDCSLIISDVRADDRRRYYFRFEKGESKYSYLEFQLLVNVTELRDQPVLRVPEVLKPGQPVNVTCQAPGTCSGTPPQITWTGGFDSTAMDVSEPQGNGSVSFSSVLHFTPTLAHDGKELGCTVTYPAVGVSTRRALRLHVDSQLSQGQVYRIQVAPHVTVQQGLCVLLPCHFTADFESPGPLYKYWFVEGTDKDHGVPVASTNPDRPPQESRGRIRLAGEAEDDCSLIISDVRADDRRRYYFRFEKGESKYSYLEFQLLVNVTELRDQPVLRVPEVLKPGQPVNVTCQAPGTCSGTPPQITWTGGFDSTAMDVSEPQGNGSVSYSSVLHFTPTLAHDGTELGCTVTYPAVGVSTRRALRLHVDFQLSQGQVYRIQVAPHVTVQQGLCVLLPCHFTADFESPGPLYKYWFLEGADKDHGVPVASTNPDRPPQESRGRIRLAGEAEDDCSLSISDVRAEDRRRYYFRFEKGESKYSYLEFQLLVNVTELRDQPVLRVPEVLKPGQPVNVTCQAPGTCSGTPPQITWTGGFDSTAMDVSEPQGNGSVSYSSVLHFTPTLAHDGKELGCTVTYPAVGVSTRRALRLHVDFQLSQGQVYRIQVAPHVTVQQGLCVLLPCHFTADFESPGPLYKYWFLEGADKDHGVPVASTNPDRPPQESRGRIRLAGEAEDDCSLIISDVRADDRRHYYFRFEKGESKYSYLEFQLLVNVTELTEQPVLRVPEVLKPGQPVNVTCQAPGTCSGTPPQITWTGGFDSAAMDVSEPQGNGSVSYSSVLHFTPTLAHDGKELGCTVTYPEVGLSTRRALRLHVGYAPELLPGGNCTMRGSGPGGATTCYCAAEGNPPPHLQWRLPNRAVPGDFEGPELRAKSWAQGPAVSGELQGPAGALTNVSCAAANAHGQSQAELPLVPAGDGNFLLRVCSGVIGGILLLLMLVIMACKERHKRGSFKLRQQRQWGEAQQGEERGAVQLVQELSTDDYENREQVENDENLAEGGDGA
ncbi:uncharacterized protein LOC102448662 isoform X2 [Pelodiscus sinensis]